MLDLKLLRDNPDAIREALAKRRVTVSLDGLLQLEQSRRALLTAIETDRAELNR